MKKVFTFFLTLFVASSAWAYGFEVDGICYCIDEKLNSSVSVTFGDYSGSITIPSSVTYGGKTYSVTSIGDYAFHNCSGLTSVTIPNSVTSVGKAFYNCSGLTSVTIPESLDVSDADIYFTKDGIRYQVLNGKEVELDGINEKSTGDLVIPQIVSAGNTFTVTSIGEDAFEYCTGLTSVTIHNSVTSIGEDAFYGCSGLTSVTIPNSVTSIGNYAFRRCSGLTSVTIGNSVTSIGYDAFYECSGLKEVINLSSLKIEKRSSDNGCVAYYAAYVYNGGKITVGDFLFSKNDKILNQYVGSSANVVLPENFEGGSYTIGSNAFANHTEIQSLTIPSSVTSIGKYAFDGCKNLKEVINLSSLKIEKGSYDNGYVARYADYVYNGGKIVVGDFLFSKNDKILKQYVGSSANVVLPENFEGGSYTIGSNAFVNHTEIQSLTISSSVTSIGYQAFSGCTNLTSVTIPESLDVSDADIYFTKDGMRYYVLNGKEVAVASNSYTGNIVIPSSVTAGNTFSVTSIGYQAFWDCSGLTSVTIPNSVTSIGNYAFGGCTSLTRVTNYAVKPQAIESSTFETYNAYLYIPCDNFDAYDLDNNWGNFKHIECVSAEETVVTKDAVSVEPEITEAVFSMPTTTTANSYSLTISNNNVTFCTLTFNNQGQLSNIDFSGNTLKSEIEGYQFTVTGLSASTDYGYSFKVLSKSKAVLKEYTGKFTTKAENGIGGSSEGGEYSEGGDKEQNYTITVSSANNAQGTVVGSGSYENGKTATLVAVPSAGYKFVQWNDGNTDNPRIITVTGNATFIATFAENTNTEPQSSYTITAISANNEQGTVVGGGSFAANATTVLAVVPATGYKFVSWNDGNTENPRTITVTGDAFYVATFERISTAINDVEEEMLVTISNRQILVNGEAPEFVITSVGQKIANQNLKAGVYFVQVGNEMQGVAVK